MADKGEVRGCVIRKELHYLVDDHTWARVNDDGTVTVGMTDVAQGMAGPLLHAKTKSVGTQRKKGRPIATVESGKRVGPVKTPISGEVVEVNEAVAQDAKIINQSPYDRGWIVRMNPISLDADLSEMVSGGAAVEAYREKIEKDDLKGCDHVEGFEA